MVKTSIWVFFVIWNGVLSYEHIDRFRRKIPEGKIANHLENFDSAGFKTVIVHSPQSDKEGIQSAPAAYSTASFHQYIPGRGQHSIENEKLIKYQPDTGQIRIPSSAPGQNRIPFSAPGQNRIPSSTPGQNRIPFSAPGQHHIPSSAPGQHHIPSSAPGQSRIPSSAPGKIRIPSSAPEQNNWNIKPTNENPQNIQQLIYNTNKYESNKQAQPNRYQNEENPLDGTGPMVHENKYTFGGQQLKFDEFENSDEDPEFRITPEKRESSFSENKIITAKKYQYSYAMEDGDVGGVPTKPKYVSHKKYMYMKVNSKEPGNVENSGENSAEQNEHFSTEPKYWQKLSPNVEFSPSLEAATIDYPPRYTENLHDSEENLGLRDRRRNILRGTEDQALYFTNQFADEDNTIGRDNFDHDYVLSQSNKFDISNAMIPEALHSETGNPLEDTNYQDISKTDTKNDFQNLKNEFENENTYDNFEIPEYLTKEPIIETSKEPSSSGYGLKKRNPKNIENDYFQENRNYYQNYQNKRPQFELKAPSYSSESFRSPTTFTKSNKYFQKGQLSRPNVVKSTSNDDEYYLNRRNAARHYYSASTPNNDESFPYRFDRST